MRRRVLWSALAVATVTLVAGLIAGAVINRRLVEERENELLRQADATASLVASAIRENIPQSENADLTVRRTLEIARTVGGHDFVEARLVGADASRVGLAFPSPLLESLGTSPELETVVATEVDGEPVLAYVRSVPVTQRRDGLRVVIAIGRTEPLLTSNVLAQPLLISLGIGAVLAVVLAAGVSRHIGRRLDMLGGAAQEIAGGDLSARAPVEGHDDVARLGNAFNNMAQRLEDSRQRERDFLMSVGHDLRTPLTTIRGYAEALDGGEVDAGELARVGGVLRRQTDRLSRLIEDLMLLARLEAREFTLRTERVDLAAHLRELIGPYEDKTAALHVALTTEIEEVGEAVVDPDRFSQIVANLLDNALRYTPEGGAVTVRLAGDGSIALVVTDTGPGIDPEDIPHVFERMYVAQRYRAVRPEGSGLGLSIVRELVVAIGGTIGIESAPGRGAVVTIRIPRTT